MRSSARSAGARPARNSVRRWTSAMTRFVVTSVTRPAMASRNRRSASAWCWSRWLRSAIHAPLSTKTRAGAATRAIRSRRLGNERLVEVAVEVLAQVGGQAVDVAAEVEQGVFRGLPRERAHGGANRLRLGPAARPGPAVEPLEIAVVEVDLQRAGHDQQLYRIM